MPFDASREEAPWKAGLRSARANLLPGLALQAFALAILLGYCFWPPVHDALVRLAELRVRTGVAFGVVSTALFGGLIPLLYLKANPATRADMSWPLGLALIAFWAFKGLEIGAWYLFMAWCFGEAASLHVIALKALLDQFVYCPLWAIPTTALVYQWCRAGFSTRAVAADLRKPRWYARRVLPMLLANLGVWLPVVCIIYALPTPLQLTLQNVVLCFFTLMLAHLSRHAHGRPA